MLTLSLLSLAHAATWTVDPSGGGDATTVADGVGLLVDGDTLVIAAGTYDVMHVYLGVGNVVIRGSGRDSTIFDGTAGELTSDSMGLGLWAENVVFEGIGFRNYAGLDNYESAVYVDGSATFVDCGFVNNRYGAHATYRGQSSLTFFGTLFTANEYAIYVPENVDSLDVENSLFVDNHAVFKIGEEHNATWFNRISFLNNTFVGSEYGVMVGGQNIYSDPGASEVVLVNNLFSGALMRWSLGYGSARNGLSAEIRNNVYSSTTTEGQRGELSTIAESDNLEAEPEFVARSDDGDWTNDDLHLVAGSPGIDAGVDGYASVTTDFEGADRVIDGDGDGLALPDAGAYEYCPPDVCVAADTGTTVDTAADTEAADDTDTPEPSDTGGAVVTHSIFGCTTTGLPPSGLALALVALLSLRRREGWGPRCAILDLRHRRSRCHTPRASPRRKRPSLA